MRRLVLLLALITLVVGTLVTGARADARAIPAPLPGIETPIPAQLQPGTMAIVAADGDCLNIRFSPGLGGTQIACAEDGSEVTVLEGTVDADGFTWQHVRVDEGNGWAAAIYLVAAEAPTVTQPDPTPVVPVVPVVPVEPESEPACDTRGASTGMSFCLRL